MAKPASNPIEPTRFMKSPCHTRARGTVWLVALERRSAKSHHKYQQYTFRRKPRASFALGSLAIAAAIIGTTGPPRLDGDGGIGQNNAAWVPPRRAERPWGLNRE